MDWTWSEQDLVADEESAMVCFIHLQLLVKKSLHIYNYYIVLSVSFQNIDLLFFFTESSYCHGLHE